MDWIDIAPRFITVPITAWKYRTTAQKLWKKAMALTKLGRTNIVVLGRPGVGKSVMLDYINNESHNLKWELPKRSTDTEINTLTAGEWTRLVRVIPGQSSEARAEGIEEALNYHNSLEGIIYVVDWGYTANRDPISRQIQIDNRGLTTIDKIREHNLKNELDDFKIICEKITTAFQLGKNPSWLLIVANKTDLFFNKNELLEAQKYYHPSGNSEFSTILKATLDEVGAGNLKCESIPLCSFEEDFIWNGKSVKTSIKGEINRKALLQNFYNTIANF